MTDEQLRAMVRDAVARELSKTAGSAWPSAGISGPGGSGAVLSDWVASPGSPVTVMSLAAARQHISHAMFTVTAGAEADGACVIEPAVPCTHCGYCKSFGC